MHSSGMRTACLFTVCQHALGGVCLGVFAQGAVCLWRVSASGPGQGGVCLGGVCQGGVCLWFWGMCGQDVAAQGGCLPRGSPKYNTFSNLL